MKIFLILISLSQLTVAFNPRMNNFLKYHIGADYEAEVEAEVEAEADTAAEDLVSSFLDATGRDADWSPEFRLRNFLQRSIRSARSARSAESIRIEPKTIHFTSLF